MLARHEEGAREIRASFFRVDGAVRHLDVATSRPSRDARGLLRLFNERLERIGEDGLDTGYGFDLIRLAALVGRIPAGEQAGLRSESACSNAASHHARRISPISSTGSARDSARGACYGSILSTRIGRKAP